MLTAKLEHNGVGQGAQSVDTGSLVHSTFSEPQIVENVSFTDMLISDYAPTSEPYFATQAS